VHELSIAQAILERVTEAAMRNGGARPTRVGVRVGEISGLDCDALAFGFECLVKGSDREPLTLEIEYCPRRQRCSHCAHEFAAPNSETICPRCGAFDTVCVGGQELDLVFIEVEDE
jgi:hydrogenase nickel incorporation protein HypA/HybF